MDVKVLNLLTLLLLAGWLGWLVTFRDGEITREALQRFFKPLLGALSLWCLERVCDIAVDSTKDDAPVWWFAAAASLNAATSLLFFYCGRNLLSLRDRLLRAMRPSRPDTPFWKSWKSIVTSRPALVVAWIIAVIAAFGPPLLQTHAGQGPIPPQMLIYAGAASAGMIVLGLGLTRELTRERREFIGLAAGFSIILYGAIQLLAVYPPIADTARVIALMLKALFVVAIASFWVMIREVARADRERPTVGRFKRRFWREIHDISGNLSAIPQLTEVIRKTTTARDDPEALTCLREIDELLIAQNIDLRKLMALMRGAGSLRGSLEEALDRSAEEERRKTTARIVLTCVGGPSDLTAHEEECFYWVAREAIRNAVRHAKQMTLLNITLDRTKGRLIVKDDGQGDWISGQVPEGHGLEMMYDWAAEVDAVLLVERRSPAGMIVSVEIPDDRK